MLFVHRNDVVEELPTATPNPAFRDPILPGCLDTRSLGREAGRFQHGDYIRVEFRVAIQDHIAISTCVEKRLTQLLHDPIRSWLTRNVEVQDPAAPVLNHEETIQNLESQCGHGEQIRCNEFASR